MATDTFVISLEDTTPKKIFNALSSSMGFISTPIYTSGGQYRYQLFAIEPQSTLSFDNGFVTKDEHTVIESPKEAFNNFFEEALKLPSDEYLPFSGGILGYVSFEGAMLMREFDFTSKNQVGNLPQVFFGLYDTFVLFDSIEKTAKVVSLGWENGISNKARAAKRSSALAEHILYRSSIENKLNIEDNSDESILSLRFQDVHKEIMIENSVLSQASKLVQQKTKASIGHPADCLQHFMNSQNETEWVSINQAHSCVLAKITENYLRIDGEKFVLQTQFNSNHPKLELENLSQTCASFAQLNEQKIFRDENLEACGRITGTLASQFDIFSLFASTLPSPKVNGSYQDEQHSILDKVETQARQFFGGCFVMNDTKHTQLYTLEESRIFTESTMTSFEPFQLEAEPNTELEQKRLLDFVSS